MSEIQKLFAEIAHCALLHSGERMRHHVNRFEVLFADVLRQAEKGAKNEQLPSCKDDSNT